MPIENTKGKLSISRVHSGHGKPDFIHIEVLRDDKYIRVLDVDVSCEEFALAVTSLSDRPCDIVIYTLPKK